MTARSARMSLVSANCLARLVPKQLQTRYRFRWGVDKDGQIGRQFLGILGTPTTFIVDKSGRLVSKTVSAIDFDKLRRFLDASLR